MERVVVRDGSAHNIRDVERQHVGIAMGVENDA